VFSVRAATREDLPGIVAVEEAVIGDRHGDEVLARAIDASHVLVAEADGAILAYLRWETFWDTMPLCLTVRVLAGHRRRGIGRTLYGAAEEAFRATGAAFWLSSTEESNERSLLFHEAVGFRHIGTLHELGQDAGEIFLRKDLT
jgi:L-amino acid N-acyltransferase YncA